MSAAPAGAAQDTAANITAAINAKPTQRSGARVPCRLLSEGVALFDIDIVIAPWMLLVYRVLVSAYPRMNEYVLVAVGVENPWCVGVDELRHPAEKPGTLRALGELLRLIVELVELRQIETRQVGHARVRAVEKRHEAEPLRSRIDSARE